MRKGIKIIILSLLLAAGAVVCALRWQAWFGMPAELQWTGDTLNYVFPYPTAERSYSDTVLQCNGPAGEAGLTALVLGDIHNRLHREDYDTLAARVPDADFVIQTGDWMERGQDYYHQLLLREWTNSALYGLPVIACAGNHEYSKGVNKTLSPVWEKAFSHPQNGPQAVPGASYFVDYQQIRFIVIDTNPLTRLVFLTRTLTWLHATMDSAGNRYIVVLMHHPVLSAGKGRFNTLVYATFRYALGKADLVIAGHDHSYMRRSPFIVINAAGKPKPQQMPFVPEVTDSVPVYGILQSQIINHKSQMRLTIHRMDDGIAIDSLYVNHD